MEYASQNFDLERFVTAHNRDFSAALAQICRGRKEGHWIWYIFPQIAGFGTSWESQYFAIPDLAAAQAFMDHPCLRENMIAICRALLELEENNPCRILDTPDDLKLRASMTLFELAAPEVTEFAAVLEKFYAGARDPMTLGKLGAGSITE